MDLKQTDAKKKINNCIILLGSEKLKFAISLITNRFSNHLSDMKSSSKYLN